MIRKHASIGDFVVGTGSAKRHRSGFLVYFMRIEEIVTYDDYWSEQRFYVKRPFLRGSKKQAFGDNIYHRHPQTGTCIQANSLHSMADGAVNPLNVQRDTKSENVLVSNDFAYWGGTGPEIPALFRNFEGADICAKRGHKNRFSDHHRDQFIDWLRSLNAQGFIGRPLDWKRTN